MVWGLKGVGLGSPGNQLKEMSQGLLPNPHGADLLPSEEKLTILLSGASPCKSPLKSTNRKNKSC